MVIFAVFSYELGRQVKASIFSLKGMLAFFIIVPYRGGTIQQGRLFSQFPNNEYAE